jgi:hypothetical protein
MGQKWYQSIAYDLPWIPVFFFLILRTLHYSNWSLYNKVPLNAENTLTLFKERRPYKFLKKLSIGTMANHKLSIDTTFDPW